MLNDPIKTFHPIEENELEVSECQIFSDRCHGLQPSETAGLLSCASTVQRAKSHTDSDLANQVDGEGIQASHRRFLQ
jgi:hypothetical protein